MCIALRKRNVSLLEFHINSELGVVGSLVAPAVFKTVWGALCVPGGFDSHILPPAIIPQVIAGFLMPENQEVVIANKLGDHRPIAAQPNKCLLLVILGQLCAQARSETQVRILAGARHVSWQNSLLLRGPVYEEVLQLTAEGKNLLVNGAPALVPPRVGGWVSHPGTTLGAPLSQSPKESKFQYVCENVPERIRQGEHKNGVDSTLANLAAFPE